MKDLFESMANDFKPKNALITKEMNEINILKEQYTLNKITLAEMANRLFEAGEMKSEKRCNDQLEIARAVIRELLGEKKILVDAVKECISALELIEK
jgi:hypothetical protein